MEGFSYEYDETICNNILIFIGEAMHVQWYCNGFSVYPIT